jgi:hypothetical protein
MRVEASEQQWPQLAEKLMAFGARHSLETFNTSKSPVGLHMFEVSLCSRKGLFIWADNRLWADPMPNQDPLHVLVLLNRYGDGYDWRPVAKDLQEAFKDWPGTVESKYGNVLPTAANK